MRTFVTLALATTVIGCSSNASVGGGPTPETIRVAGPGGGSVTLMSNAEAIASHVSYPIAQVWRVLPAAYDSVGLGVATTDPATHIVDNGGLKLRRQLRGVPLSRYIDCGGTQIGSSADSYDIILSVRTQVRPDGTAAAFIMTLVDAMGKPIAFGQEYSKCTSTGKLEARLADVIQAKLQR